MKRHRNLLAVSVCVTINSLLCAPTLVPADESLVGYWPFRGDARDHSGRENHGANHGVDLETGTFDGLGDYVEVPASDSLRFGSGDFTLSAWVYTESAIEDAVGDVLELYDPAQRRGITLSVNSSASGYLSQTKDRHVYFGIDNARMSDWQDCGKPGATSTYVSNSMLVFKGSLYAAIIDAKDEKDWCHVYRYEGDQKWADSGRVGSGRTTGVGPLIVHEGELYAVTTTYDWTRVQAGPYDPGRVYRYGGGTTWVDCGQPSENRTLNCAASYKGKLYAGGGPKTWGVHVRNDDGVWQESVQFPKRGPKRCYPHPMTRWNGLLFTGFPSVYSFDGNQWTYAGVPSEPESKLQTHCFTVFQGRLTAGTWPLAKVSRYMGGEKWEEFGRVGEDGTEVNSLVVYNGKLYGGSIPRAEVCRYDGRPQWTTLRRFYSPDGWIPTPPSENGGNPTAEQLNAWSRVTSMTIHRGRLFAGIGNCTSAIVDAPPGGVHGHVFSMEAGKCVSCDDELQPGWRHLAAVREGGRLRLFIDGKLVAESSAFDPSQYNLSHDRPLRIGFGQTDYFHGRIADVRVHKKALTPEEIGTLSAVKPQSPQVYDGWPFDAAEAVRRQAETAQATQNPVVLQTSLTKDGPSITWRLIPAGKFMIGSPESEDGHEGDERQREETIGEPFYMMETQLTVEQYCALMQAEPAESGDGGDPKLPAGISYRDTVDKVLPALAKLAPGGWKVILPDHVRLEYAARAGVATMNPGGNKKEDAAPFAWSRENSGGKVHPVAQKKPNAWGLHDVIGNRWHWFWRAGAGYGNDSTDDHIVYGGSCNSESGGNGVRLANIMISQRPEGARFALIRAGAPVPQGHPETRNKATAFTGSAAGDERELAGLKFCWCPPGKFTMGSPPGERGRRSDEAQVEVTLTRGFWMGKYEVTQSQWKKAAGEIPGKLIAGEGDDFPVYWVSFIGAEEFCRKLTTLARTAGELPEHWEFRMPTEAQWEYACRAGTTTAFSCGDTLTNQQANIGKPYDGSPDGTPGAAASKVGSYPANPWGLHDMHGNEFEWCRDWYHDKLPGGTDPDLSERKGIANRDGTYSRVRRGGAWNDAEKFCRSALRLRYEPDRNSDHIGFRIVVVKL